MHNFDDCWAAGGGKAGQGPKWKKKKKKGKEKAGIADKSGGTSNVAIEHCLATNEINFSDYLQATDGPKMLPSIPPMMEDSMHSACATMSLTPIIDSGASSHIFLDQSAFTTYSHTISNISGFSASSSSIMGHSTVK